jgi:elongation factor 1 alpha-like protein
MIKGVAQADAGILVIDAEKGAFEAGFGKNGQTKEHSLLALSMGVKQLIVAINKMDTVGYDEERFGPSW